MQIIDRVPKRIWVTGGVVLALCGGVAAASAGSHGSSEASTIGWRSHGVLKLAYAAPPPLVAPSPATDRLDVLAPPPESLANLDPDLQQSSDYAALAASMKRFDAQLAADAASADARPLPAALTVTAPSPAPSAVAFDTPRPAAHEDDVAASGATGRAPAEALDAD